jgi:hypothetical protein
MKRSKADNSKLPYTVRIDGEPIAAFNKRAVADDFFQRQATTHHAQEVTLEDEVSVMARMPAGRPASES